jgi:threonine aldolase
MALSSLSSVQGTTTTTTNNNRSAAIDLRSDTVTAPSREMLLSCLSARTGDDVLGEDPTVLELQDYVADLFGKQHGLFVPTGTMANLVAVLAHCHGRASELLVGANSHIHLYEGGNVAGLGGVYARQLVEHPTTAEFTEEQVRDNFRSDGNDDHFARTAALCLENTHNLLGGVALRKGYVDRMGRLCQSLNLRLHVDGARIWNASVALNTSVQDLCEHVDSVAVCLSKGLGAPLGSVLVGSDLEFLRLAKRARKRCGGGMRQAGVVAAMGLHALQHNFERLAVDHHRARVLAGELHRHGFHLPNGTAIDTNIVYFDLPADSRVPREQFCQILQAEHGVKLVGGYGSRGGGALLFRAVTHLDLKDGDVERAADAMVKVCYQDR